HVGELGLLFARAHVGPHDARLLNRWIGEETDAALEVALGRLGRHIHALAGSVELPSVVDATQPGLFIATQEERGQPVRTVLVEQPHISIGVAERNEVFTQQLHAYWWRVRGRQLAGEQGWHPVATQYVAHRGTGPDARNQLILFPGQ